MNSFLSVVATIFVAKLSSTLPPSICLSVCLSHCLHVFFLCTNVRTFPHITLYTCSCSLFLCLLYSSSTSTPYPSDFATLSLSTSPFVISLYYSHCGLLSSPSTSTFTLTPCLVLPTFFAPHSSLPLLSFSFSLYQRNFNFVHLSHILALFLRPPPHPLLTLSFTLYSFLSSIYRHMHSTSHTLVFYFAHFFIHFIILPLFQLKLLYLFYSSTLSAHSHLFLRSLLSYFSDRPIFWFPSTFLLFFSKSLLLNLFQSAVFLIPLRTSAIILGHLIVPMLSC